MRIGLFTLLLGLFGLAGAALADPALVGRWSGTGPTANGQSSTVAMELSADGSLFMEQGGKSVDGTWAAADGLLSLTITRGDGALVTLTCAYLVADGSLTLSGEQRDCAEAPVFTRVD